MPHKMRCVQGRACRRSKNTPAAPNVVHAAGNSSTHAVKIIRFKTAFPLCPLYVRKGKKVQNCPGTLKKLSHAMHRPHPHPRSSQLYFCPEQSLIPQVLSEQIIRPFCPHKKLFQLICRFYASRFNFAKKPLTFVSKL